MSDPNNLFVRIQHPMPPLTLEVEINAVPGVTVIFGPSGAGKTTLLDCIAGLRAPRTGWVRINDDVLFDSVTSTDVVPERRRIGYVFQSASLFPHLSAEENVRFGLGARPEEEQKERAHTMLDQLGAKHLSTRRPRELSGGEQQRVALAR